MSNTTLSDSQLPLQRAPLLGMILFLSMLVILPGCDTAGGAAAQAGSANPAAPVPEVGIIQVEPRAITLDTELSGRTAAYMTAEVRPQVSGIFCKET